MPRRCVDAVILFAPILYPPDRSSKRAAKDRRGRSVVARAAAALLVVGWMPGSAAVLAAGMGGWVPVSGAEGWVCLAAGGVPLGLGWFVLREARPAAAWTALLVLAALVIVWCAFAATSGPAMQAAGAAAIGSVAWLPLAMRARRRRRKVVWLINPAMRSGLLSR